MKKRYWITLIGATLLVAIVVLIPLGIERYAEKWLADQGVPNAAIGNIDLNLFTGTLLIESVDFSGTAEQRGQIDLVALNAQWTELFKQRILVANIAIAGAQLDVLQLDDGRYLLGGLTIPLASSSSSTATEPEPEPDVAEIESAASNWGFGLDNVSLDDLQVTYRDKRLHSRLSIDQVRLDRLASWEPERRSEISAKLNLDGAAISLHSSVAPFAPAPSATSSLSVAELQLLPYAALFDQLGLADLSGAVSIDLTSNAHREEAGAIGLNVSGSARLDDLGVTLPTARVSNRQLSWAGELAATVAAADAEPQVSGSMNLSANSFALAHPQQPLRLVEFDKFAIEGVLIKSLDLIEIGGLSIRDLSMLSSADATALSIADTQLTAIRVAERAKLTVERAVFNDMLGLVERDAAGNLEPSTTILAAFAQGSPSPAASPSPSPSPAAAAGDAQTVAAELGTTENAFTFNFSVLEIGGNSRVRVIDRNVSPPLTTMLKIKSLRLSEVRNDDPAQPMHVQFDIQQDDNPTLTGEGDLWLFGEKPASDMQIAVNSFDLPQISSYVPGYHIDRGRLSINTHVTLKDDKLDITNDLTIEKLKLSGKAAGNQKLLGQGMAMPLDVALDLLRDGDDRIKLELPISGSINDPKFETADVFQSIIQGALQKTAMNYVKTALQPLGTIMMVTKIAGKAARPRFEPVVFERGNAQLSAKSRAYLDKIAKLLAERPGLNITLCGVSTQIDHDYLLAQMPSLLPEVQSQAQSETQQEVQPPAPASAAPDFATERMQLAMARGNTTMEYLTNSGGINADRLYRCRPTLEANADQPPRAEITL